MSSHEDLGKIPHRLVKGRCANCQSDDAVLPSGVCLRCISELVSKTKEV